MVEVGEEALDLLMVRDVARRLRLSETTIWRLVYREISVPGTGIKSVKVGRSRRIPPESVVAYTRSLQSGNAA